MNKKTGIIVIAVVVFAICFTLLGFFLGKKYFESQDKDNNKQTVSEKEEPKREEEKEEEPSKDEGTKETTDEEDEDLELYGDYRSIISLNDSIGNYKIQSIDGCSISNNSLKGDCAIFGIKDKKVVDMVEYFGGEGPDAVYVLTEDKTIYLVSYGEEDLNDVEEILKDSEIADIGLSFGASDCNYQGDLLVKKGTDEYYLTENNKLELVSKKYNDTYPYFGVETCAQVENGKLSDISTTYTKKVLTSDEKVIKDKNTNKDIIASYVIYSCDEKNGEVLYIVSNDNKLYKLTEEVALVEVVDTVKKVTYTPKTDKHVMHSDKIVVELKSGKKLQYLES